MRAKGVSNSSRNMVKASRDSVMKNHSLSYKRFHEDKSREGGKDIATHLHFIGSQCTEEDSLNNVAT